MQSPSTTSDLGIGSTRTNLGRFLVSWLLAGLVFGVGLSLAYFALLPLGEWWMSAARRAESNDSSLNERPLKPVSNTRYGPDSGLLIESERAERSDNEFRILGKIRNTGGDTWDSVHLQAVFFDADGSFRDLCDGLVWAPLRPGEQRYFALSCSKQLSMPVPAQVTYKLEIVGASPGWL